MKAWLYARLNHEAKAWPYHVGHRPKQRASIRDDLRHIREALATPGAHATKGHGGNSLVAYDKHGNRWSLSGFGEYDLETYRLCGIPIIDVTTADYGELCHQVCRGPMIQVGKRDAFFGIGDGPFQDQPLEVIARRRKAIGATIHNLDI